MDDLIFDVSKKEWIQDKNFESIIKTTIIPGLERMLEKEKKHLLFLEQSNKTNSFYPRQFIANSKEAINRIENSLKEYNDYLKNTIK